MQADRWTKRIVVARAGWQLLGRHIARQKKMKAYQQRDGRTSMLVVMRACRLVGQAGRWAEKWTQHDYYNINHYYNSKSLKEGLFKIDLLNFFCHFRNEIKVFRENK